jgi:LmbE family N-acetylglucosaminyl deacetylase
MTNNHAQLIPDSNPLQKSAIVVAHPDDEILWCGGYILENLDREWHIITLCRGDDADRALKFRSVMETLEATGAMGSLDDGPEQRPLNQDNVQKTILSLLPSTDYDLIITHGPGGEYTRHRRHEETCLAMIDLWKSKKINSTDFWMFAYGDGEGEYLPRPKCNADLIVNLPNNIWREKYNIITKIYGFAKESFEAKTTPQTEAFWCFKAPEDGCHLIQKGER